MNEVSPYFPETRLSNNPVLVAASLQLPKPFYSDLLHAGTATEVLLALGAPFNLMLQLKIYNRAKNFKLKFSHIAHNCPP